MQRPYAKAIFKSRLQGLCRKNQAVYPDKKGFSLEDYYYRIRSLKSMNHLF
jgi:hypothetical protein